MFRFQPVKNRLNKDTDDPELKVLKRKPESTLLTQISIYFPSVKLCKLHVSVHKKADLDFQAFLVLLVQTRGLVGSVFLLPDVRTRVARTFSAAFFTPQFVFLAASNVFLHLLGAACEIWQTLVK